MSEIKENNYHLNQVVSILNKHKINHWIDWGTLLGVIRDNELFDWDNDIDISLNYTDLDKVINIIDLFREMGYNVQFEKDFPFIDSMIKLYLPKNKKNKKSNISHIDLYFYKINDEGYWLRNLYLPKGRNKLLIKRLIFLSKVLVDKNYYTKDWMIVLKIIPMFLKKIFSRIIVLMLSKLIVCRYNFIPKRYYREFINYQFGDILIKIPSDTMNYLAYLYGDTWSTPNPNWDWRKDGPTQKIRPANMFPPPVAYIDKNKGQN